MANAPLRLHGRLALRIEEAAEALGLSKGAFREYLLADCPKIRVGRAVRIPLEPFKEYLKARAEQDGATVGDSIDELFDGLDDEGPE